jgi:GH24 family phage-related lysozyme (muramidase)
MYALIKRLKKHEGLTLTVKPDLDKHVIGYGHQCDKDHPPIALHEAEEYLLQDAYRASDAYMRWKARHELRLSRVRDEVLCELVYWHGFRGFLGFREMCKAVIAGDYDKAADELMDSDSGRKYKPRMYELSVMMREG